MEVEFVKTWRRKTPGTLSVLPDGVANVLIRRGFCEEVKPKPKPKPKARKKATKRANKSDSK